jgi:hypothetical protein
LGHGLRNATPGDDLDFTLALGGASYRSYQHDTKQYTSVSFISLETRDKDNPQDLSKINKRGAAGDYTLLVVGRLATPLIINWLGEQAAAGRVAMPWLAEGFCHYLCIKNLGLQGPGTVDRDTTYAGQRKQYGYRWSGDVEKTFHRIAQDPTVDDFQTLLLYTKFRNLGARVENVAKCASIIDFLMETNRVGFLNFLKDLQKQYRKLNKTRNQQEFMASLDGLIAANLGAGAAGEEGAPASSRRKSTELNSVDDLESAWREWAANWVKKENKIR